MIHAFDERYRDTLVILHGKRVQVKNSSLTLLEAYWQPEGTLKEEN